MNEQARLLLEDARSIASEEDHFKLCVELLESIDSVQRGDESRDGMHPHVVDLESVSRSHRRLELQLIEQQTFVSPLASSKTPQTLVFLADPDHLDAGLEARMQVLYGLTRAEACVARYIVSGYSVENISHILAKSENTVRVQLKSTMRKCKVGSQAQFVGLVHRGLATLR
jgi:DNA-binding CsgD family transcriptional regulator